MDLIIHKFTIQGRLDGLNDYIKACRSNKYAGNTMKHKNQGYVEMGIIQACAEGKLKKICKYPVKLKITWYEPNYKRDIDNIVFATKFIQDALVNRGMLENDGQKQISGISHEVLVDRKHPRIEVEILEVE